MLMVAVQRVVVGGLVVVILTATMVALSVIVRNGAQCQQLSAQYVAALQLPASSAYDRPPISRGTIINERREAYQRNCG